MAPISDVRPLSADERALLEWLLRHGIPAAEQYLDQLDRVTVVSRCSCGCPTIDLAVDGNTAPMSAGSDILADFEARPPEGGLIGILLHVRIGLLSELEVYSISGEQQPTSLPRIQDIAR
jgi:hypothetical protein